MSLSSQDGVSRFGAISVSDHESAPRVSGDLKLTKASSAEATSAAAAGEERVGEVPAPMSMSGGLASTSPLSTSATSMSIDADGASGDISADKYIWCAVISKAVVLSYLHHVHAFRDGGEGHVGNLRESSLVSQGEIQSPGVCVSIMSAAANLTVHTPC